MDIKRATIAELQQVPGIGPRTAEAIVRLGEIAVDTSGSKTYWQFTVFRMTGSRKYVGT